jgi:hypothetical protein
MLLLNGTHKTLLKQVFREGIIAHSPAEERTEIGLARQEMRKNLRSLIRLYVCNLRVVFHQIPTSTAEDSIDYVPLRNQWLRGL